MQNNTFESDSVYMEKIKRIFKKRNDEDVELIWNLITLLIYQGTAYPEIPYLYEKLGLNNFLTLCQILGGQKIRFPTRQEIEENLLTALLYYEREVLGLEWAEIKSKYPELEISSIKYAIHIKRLDSFVKMRIKDIMKDVAKMQDDFQGFMADLTPEKSELNKEIPEDEYYE
jgi:hypothetical protein